MTPMAGEHLVLAQGDAALYGAAGTALSLGSVQGQGRCYIVHFTCIAFGSEAACGKPLLCSAAGIAVPQGGQVFTSCL